jgi:hypothetical protein
MRKIERVIAGEAVGAVVLGPPPPSNSVFALKE